MSFYIKQKTAYELRISDWSSDVCSSDLREGFKTRIPSVRTAESCGVAPLTNTEHHHGTDPAAESHQPRQPGRQGQRQARLRPQLPRAPRQGSAGHGGQRRRVRGQARRVRGQRSEEQTSEHQSLMRNSYALFCLKEKKITHKKQVEWLTNLTIRKSSTI